MTEQLIPGQVRKASLLDYLSLALVKIAIFMLRLLPLDGASAIGGKVARFVGPHIKGASRTARKNLLAAFPEKSDGEIEEILKDVWENLGRTAAEFAMMERLKPRIRVEGEQWLKNAGKDGIPTIYFSAHLGNWEAVVMSPTLYGVTVNAFYRAPNNPLMMKFFAGRESSGELIPKGAAGARRAFALLKKGQSLGLLIDQKLNDGIALPFFGRNAMTGTALAEFALRFNSPIIPIQCIRENGANLRLVFHPPLEFEKTGDKAKDVKTIMRLANGAIEGWIRENPGQWLWLHRRWPD